MKVISGFISSESGLRRGINSSGIVFRIEKNGVQPISGVQPVHGHDDTLIVTTRFVLVPRETRAPTHGE